MTTSFEDLAAGEIVEGSVAAPKGNFTNPLSPEELREKFFRLGAGALPRERLEAIAGRVANLDTADDIAPLVALLSAPADV